MRGLTSYFVGSLLAGLAYYAFSVTGLSGTTMAIAGLSLILFYRGANGREFTPEAIAAPMEFVQNPAGAIVDAAVDKVGDLLIANSDTGGKGLVETARDKLEEFLSSNDEKAAETSGFDPDAVIERYLANRPEPLPDPEPDTAPARRQFGRKGL